MNNIATTTSIHNLILDAYKNVNEVSLTNPTHINHITKWI